MKKDTIAIIIAGLAAGGTIYGVFTAEKAAKFNKPFKIYEFNSNLFETEAKLLDQQGRPDEASIVRGKHLSYLRGVKAKQIIEESSIQIIYSNPEGVPEHQKEKLGNAIEAVENSPISTGTNTMSLGATYYGIENYEKALESFDIVLSDDPDDTDARILKASALVLIATTSPEYMDDKEYKTANAVEAKKLVTFNDVVLNNRQKTFLDKLKVYIDKLLGRD